ncbi:MAG: hypothetical protein IPK39_12830 [Sulfuritalea sp.]|nr:hypothetical protein [Sulfuritalea sp.]
MDRLYAEFRFGRVEQSVAADADQAAEIVEPEATSPMEILRSLELRGDKAQMEHWLQVDSSATGLGAAVPAVLPRHQIGLLICLRSREGLDWRLGFIRRIGRDAENRPSIGIETLPWPSICAQAKPGGEETVWRNVTEAGDGWLDAVIVSQEGKGPHPAGRRVCRWHGDRRAQPRGHWRVRLDSLLEHGQDFERIKITRI